MRIDNSYLSPLAGSDVRLANQTGGTTDKAAAPVAGVPLTSMHIQSAEIAQLQQFVRTLPEMRNEEIARVAQLLELGQYANAAAAQRAAAALIKAID